MAMFKCKMCGGDLVLQPGSTVAECEYCGTVQTVPTADNEKKMTLFQRANRLRFGCEFDKAAGVYEAIVAEFPEEAEAYWGLVLCKYGIEYVDDPATGKKIPTCHRSSFDSVMDDPNLDMALENADTIARRVYRDEAKAIEELRKGIVEVSSKEAPYDIFICYKETDEHGNRTLDSVLAQDVYDALTEKGYRVFFSRITLEDKLGQAYEPYIFAALHSAKIMLAFGTDYAYFNAVWVKNEWSRFLYLIASGEKKTLIPCYKGIDAYDMPKEFAKLQAQDMGKVGAIQDLLRGIDKVMGKTASVVVKETVVIQSEGGINTSALLKRGNMALEDRQYQKADEFFDRVLDIDAECAEAYFGKYLAEKRYRNMDAFKENESSPSIKCETVCPVDIIDALEACEAQYQIPGYLSRDDIGAAFEYDDFIENNDYYCIQKLDAVENAVQWNRRLRKENRLLAKANSFAKDSFAEILLETQRQIEASLNRMIADAKAEDPVVLQNTIAATNSHIEEGQRRVLRLYEEALKQKQEDKYQASCEAMKNASSAQAYQTLTEEFSQYGDYKDCQKREHQCREKMEELEAEEKRQAEMKAKQETTHRKKKKILITAITIVAVALILLMTQVVIPAQNYKKAGALLQEGRTWEAAVKYYKLGDYQDARERCFTAWNEIAEHSTLAAGSSHTVGLKATGTVVATEYTGYDYENYGQCDVSNWTDVVAISAREVYTIGLKTDGTVVAVGDNSGGRCNVSDWTDIVAISAGYLHSVGLKADGTVVATDYTGYNYDKYYRGQSDVSDWADIVAISAGKSHTVGLKANGTVVATNYTGFSEYNYGQCNVSSWTDIVAISAGSCHTVGLKSDGTVVAVGCNDDNRCDVSGWTDIIAISAGDSHTVGLKADGTVVAVGSNYNGKCNVSDWTDIIAISAGGDHTVGLKADGTVVATEYTGLDFEYEGQCDVTDWNEIKLPNEEW